MRHVEYEVVTTEIFDGWLDALTDPVATRAIAKRLVRVGAGLFGDVEAVGDGVSELRFHIGPGYRIYFTIRGRKLVILLCGGNKSSQQKDIRRAKEIAADL